MNIKPVDTYTSRIKMVGKVDDYVKTMLDRSDGKIQDLASRHDAQVKIAQRKDDTVNALYVNSGNITSRIDLKAMKNADEIYNGIAQNIKVNKGNSFCKLI